MGGSDLYWRDGWDKLFRKSGVCIVVSDIDRNKLAIDIFHERESKEIT